jgi:enamine deaminase RidA (YjgF/YER057c/UK114 family)
MATAPVSRRLNLTRDQLAAFLTDQQQIKQFELLFSTVDELQVIVGTDFEYQADTASATANEALAQISRLAQALELLSTSPVIENNNSVLTDYIDFDTKAPHVDRIRRMAWNGNDQTIEIGMEYGVIQQIGMETYARVENTTGVTIPNGTVVGFAGVGANNTLSVSPYLADGSTPTLYILGVMTHDLPDSGEVGYCTVWGHVRDVNTSAFSIGDILYASPTVAGAFTATKPTAPDNVVPVAAVLKVGTTDGEIFVRPTIEQQKYYGQFLKTTDQTPAAVNTAYAITFDSSPIANGVSIGSPASRIVVSESGLYNFAATYQLTSTSSSTKNIWLWFRVNGTDVPDSSILATLSSNNEYKSVARSDFFTLDANQYVELMWASDSTAVTLDAVASTAFAPGSPALILAVTQVQQ